MAYRANNFAALSALGDGYDLDNNASDTAAGGDVLNTLFAVGTGNTVQWKSAGGGTIRVISPASGTDGNTQCGWTMPGTSNACAFEVEFGPNSAPAAQARSLQLGTASGYAVRVEVYLDGTLRVYTPGTGSNNDMTGTTAVDSSNGYRIYMAGTTGTAGSQTVDVRLYNGSDGKSTSTTEQLLSTTATTRTDGFTYALFGLINNSGEGTFDYRNIQLEDASLGILGPMLNSAPGSLSFDGSQLTWTAVTGAQSYDIEKDGSVVATGVTNLYWVDGSASAGVGHRYRVRGVS